MSVPSSESTYGSPPYRESALKAALRAALQYSGSTFGAGLGAVPRGANFGTAFLAAAGGASKAYSAAQQAAQEYAMKQQQAQEEADFHTYQMKNIDSEIQARADAMAHQAKVDAQGSADRRKFDELTDPNGPFKMDAVSARQIVYGPTVAEQVKQKKEERPPKEPDDTSWIPPLVTTMRNGQKFLNTGNLVGKEKGAAIKWAAANGVLPVGEADGDALNNIENSRGNLDDIEKQLSDVLPKDATGRVLAYPGIKLSQLFQTNDERSAFGSFRAAAIQSLRSMAGSKGLRINQAEIRAAMHNDIPQITDTYGVAVQRLKNVRGMLDRAERPIVSKNWQSGPAPVAAPSGDIEYVRDKNGRLVPK